MRLSQPFYSVDPRGGDEGLNNIPPTPLQLLVYIYIWDDLSKNVKNNHFWACSDIFSHEEIKKLITIPMQLLSVVENQLNGEF